MLWIAARELGGAHPNLPEMEGERLVFEVPTEFGVVEARRNDRCVWSPHVGDGSGLRYAIVRPRRGDEAGNGKSRAGILTQAELGSGG